MGLNKDTQSIFEKYVNNILEAVKPVVVDEFGNETPDDGTSPAPSPEAVRASRERLKQQRANELRQQASDMKAQGIPSGSTVYSTPQGSPSSVSTTPVPDEWDEVDPDSVLPDFDLNYKTPQPQSKQTSTINSQPTSSSYTNTTTTNQSTRTGGGSTTVFADRDEAGQQAAAERAKQKREAGSQGASRIVGRADPSTAQGQAAIAQNQQNIANKQQQQASTQAAQAEKDKKSLQTMQTQGSKTFNAATNQTQNQPSTNNSGNTASSSQSQKSIDDGKFFDQMAANAGQGASASVPTSQELNKSSEKDSDQIESLKKELEELRKLMSKASDQDDEDIQEKINIKNFVRSFTRKNHSQANKYLNNLLWDKI